MRTTSLDASAPAAARVPRSAVYRTIVYFAAFICLGMTKSSIGPSLPSLAAQTGSTLSQISILFSIRAVGNLIGATVVGRLYDRMRGHALLGVELVLMAATLSLVPTVPMLWMLVAIAFVLGVAEHSLDVGINTLLVWGHGRRAGPLLNALHFFFGLGSFIVPLIVAQVLLTTGGIGWAYWALALVVLPIALIVLRLPSPQAPAQDDGGEAQAINPILVSLIVLFFFLCIAAQAGYGGWIYTYALVRGIGTEATAAYLNSAFWGALTIGRLLAIPISARLKPASMLLANVIMGLAGVAVIVMFNGAVPAVWVGTVLIGMGLGPVFATVIAYAQERMPITGKVTGYLFVGVSAGTMSLPWIIGQLFDRVGPQVLMWALLLDLSLALAAFAAVTLYSRKSTRTPAAQYGPGH